MVTLSSRPVHRITRWSLFGCLLLLVLILTACGDSGSTQSSTSSQNSTASNSNSSSSATMTGNSAGTLQTVKITEVQATNGGKDQYSFSPNTLSVKMGDMVTFINQTDEDHTLMSTPAGSIDEGNKISKNETQVVRFLTAGSFTITSMTHPDATIAVTVASAAALAPLTTVKLTEVQSTNGGKDQYSFTPNSVSVDNDTLVFVNQTDENHTLTSNIMDGFPDGSLISKNETQIIHFAKDGTYTIHSVEHLDATITVTVK